MLSEAGNNNIKVIFPFVNFWPDLGGMQWYVDQVRRKTLLHSMPYPTELCLGALHAPLQSFALGPCTHRFPSSACESTCNCTRQQSRRLFSGQCTAKLLLTGCASVQVLGAGQPLESFYTNSKVVAVCCTASSICCLAKRLHIFTRPTAGTLPNKAEQGFC